METKFKISDLRSAYEGLDHSRNWNQSGTAAENLRCDLASMLQGRIRRIRELVTVTPSRFSRDIEKAQQSIGWAEAAILRNALGRRTLWEILGTEKIPAGQYREALRVDTFSIRKLVEQLSPETITAALANLEAGEPYTICPEWILPDPEVKPANCLEFAAWPSALRSPRKQSTRGSSASTRRK